MDNKQILKTASIAAVVIVVAGMVIRILVHGKIGSLLQKISIFVAIILFAGAVFWIIAGQTITNKLGRNTPTESPNEKLLRLKMETLIKKEEAKHKMMDNIINMQKAEVKAMENAILKTKKSAYSGLCDQDKLSDFMISKKKKDSIFMDDFSLFRGSKK